MSSVDGLGRRFSVWRRSHSSRFLSVHWAAERFGVVLVIGIVLIGVLFVSVFFDAHEKKSRIFDTTVVYSQNSYTSLTHEKASVSGVWVDEGRDRAFVLMKWDEGSVNRVPLNVDDYRVFVGMRDLDMRAKPPSRAVSGGVVVFGQTGYFGVFLLYKGGVPMEVCDLTIRLDSQLHSGWVSDFEWGDDSFEKFDQLRVLVNPGVQSVGVSRELGRERIDPSGLFEELVLVGREKSLRERADGLLRVMGDDLLALGEYERRAGDFVFEGNRLVVPDRPSVIAGDSVVCEDGGVCVLHSPVDVDGSLVFEWRASSLTERGYVFSGAPGEVNSREYKDFIAEKFGECGDASLKSEGDWVFDDGSVVETRSSVGRDVSSLSSNVDAVSRARLKYFEDKKEYECDVMYEFLQLTVTDELLKENVSVRWGSDVVSMVGVG